MPSDSDKKHSDKKVRINAGIVGDDMNELQNQIALMSWARKTGDKRLDMLFHIPNGGYRRPTEAALLKASGVRAGVPDLFLPVPFGRYAGLWIELKASDGRVSAAQSEYMERLARNGYAACVAHGWRQAADCIERYLDSTFDVDRDAIEVRIP